MTEFIPKRMIDHNNNNIPSRVSFSSRKHTGLGYEADDNTYLFLPRFIFLFRLYRPFIYIKYEKI